MLSVNASMIEKVMLKKPFETALIEVSTSLQIKLGLVAEIGAAIISKELKSELYAFEFETKI